MDDKSYYHLCMISYRLRQFTAWWRGWEFKEEPPVLVEIKYEHFIGSSRFAWTPDGIVKVNLVHDLRTGYHVLSENLRTKKKKVHETTSVDEVINRILGIKESDFSLNREIRVGITSF